MFSYKTISGPAEGQFREKGSKFLSYAFPVENEGEIRHHLSALRKKYFDATHHCFAWILGAEKKIFKASDDGEPNHSAGDPILGQIRSKDLTNLLLVVVRYYGGTKLGVGGLVAAYKAAAAEAIGNANIVEKKIVKRLRIVFDYHTTPAAMKLIKDFNIRVVSQDFAESTTIEIEYNTEVEKKLLEKISLMQKTGSAIELKIINAAT